MLHEYEAFDWFKDCYATQIYVSLDQSKKVAEQNGHARHKLVALESTKSFNINISELYKILL